MQREPSPNPFASGAAFFLRKGTGATAGPTLSLSRNAPAHRLTCNCRGLTCTPLP